METRYISVIRIEQFFGFLKICDPLTLLSRLIMGMTYLPIKCYGPMVIALYGKDM